MNIKIPFLALVYFGLFYAGFLWAQQTAFEPTKVLYEAMVYEELCKFSETLKNPKFADALLKEGLLGKYQPENLTQKNHAGSVQASKQAYVKIDIDEYTSEDLDEALVQEFLKKKRASMRLGMGRPGAIMVIELLVLFGGSRIL